MSALLSSKQIMFLNPLAANLLKVMNSKQSKSKRFLLNRYKLAIIFYWSISCQKIDYISC